MTTNSAPVCYLCLDADAEDDGQPLRRDCACRGTDAGFVHLSCLVGFAASKSVQALDPNEFVEPWQVCPGCNQKYQNELRIDSAAKFVSFVRRQYPDDTLRQVEALYLKLCAFNSILELLTPVQKRELGVTANVMLSLIDRMRKVSPRVSMRYSQFQAFAHAVHGEIALDEGMEESARRAVIHFEKARVVFKAIGCAEGVATAKASIAYAKSKYEGGNDDELLKTSQEIYELRVAKHGEDDEDTIESGKHYAIDLHTANCGDEARELLTKLLATSKQVLGPHHNVTKDVESALKSVNANSSNQY